MNTSSLQRILLAAAMALPLTCTVAAHAADEDGPPAHHDSGAACMGDHHEGPGMPPPHEEGPRNGPPHGEEGPHFGPPAMGPELPFLHGVELSEAQQDKVFAILYAEMPYLRDQDKAAHKSHEALHALASGGYDDAKAAALTQTAAQAMANITLQHLRTEQKILALLTPEQRKQLAEAQPHHPPRS